MIKALLLLLSAGKLSKVLLSAGSMLLSLLIYAQLFGWRYAAGFMLLLLIHEMGHFIAAKQRGLSVGLPTFIPFVGAWIDLKQQPMNVETEAYVGFLLNLFNLIPLSPFDGGRIVAIVSPKLWLVGVPALVALFFYRPSPMLLLVALLAAPQVWSVLRGRHTEQMATGYYEASLEQKLQYGCFYLMLLCFLALMSHDVHLLLGHLRGS